MIARPNQITSEMEKSILDEARAVNQHGQPVNVAALLRKFGAERNIMMSGYLYALLDKHQITRNKRRPRIKKPTKRIACGSHDFATLEVVIQPNGLMQMGS